ncbi:MAG: hypothetical protein AAF497_20800 [Planctomycetota bacterium]
MQLQLSPRNSLKTPIRIVAVLLVSSIGTLAGAQQSDELRGNPDAIKLAKSLVETMGGGAIWSELRSVHFVHEWDLANRSERYVENEILDLTGPRSYVTMESETYSRVRAYSPENRYWNIVNGEFAYTDQSSFENAMERAPYSLYRLARAIARADQRFELQLGEIPGIPGIEAIQFNDAEGIPRGWIAVNLRNEPILWATTQYVYTLGPLKRFGNLYVPNWATAHNGLVRYEMISLSGSNQPPDPSLFAAPEDNE